MKRQMKKIITMLLAVVILSSLVTQQTMASSQIYDNAGSEASSEKTEVNRSGSQAETAQVENNSSETNDTTVSDNKENLSEEDESKDEVLKDIINSDPSTAENPTSVRPDIMKTTYRQYFSFGTTRVLKGILASSSLYFSIPKYWDTKVVYAEIEYDVSKLVTGDIPASLTFLVNGILVSSCNITYQDGSTQLAYIEIPKDILKEGYNSLEVVSYVRIYDSEGCSEDQSEANWINIKENSYIYAGYELEDHENKISYYPYPFISTANPTGLGTAILVSDKATNGEMAAALYLMADISTETGDENQIMLGLYKDATTTNAKNKIIISQTENLPEEYRKYLKENPDSTDANEPLQDLSTRAMIRFVDDANHNPLLLIVSDKEENLMEAVNMLLDTDRVSQEKLSTTFINENSTQFIYESKMLSQLVAGNYTIDGIAGGGLTYVGPFHQEKIIYLPFGNDYVLSSAGKITLKFRYSENLDFNRSLITVYWGDVPVASKKLKKENVSDDELSFTMPSDVVGTSVSDIKIVFDLEIAELFCTMRQDQMPWAYVTGNSVLYLPSRENTKLSFEYFPSPYQNNGIFSDVMIVTSDNPDSEELNLLGKIIALYGYEVAAYGGIKVIHASEFSEADADYNIITVGAPAKNSFLKTLNSSLSFQYDETGDAFISNSSLVLSDHYSRDIAAFELLKSPFVNERAVLAVCGTNDATLNQALRFLELKKKRWELKGDCVLLDSDLETKTFEFMKGEVQEEKPTIQEFVEQNKQPVIFTVMSIAAMCMLLLSAVLILIRSRKRGKNEEDQ